MIRELAWILPRIEKLESEVLRRGGGAIVPGVTSFAGPTVANQAAAIALTAAMFAASPFVFTLAQEAIWQYIPGTPGTVGVPPLAAGEVVQTTDLSGVLSRTDYSSPRWRTGVNDLWIDPSNVAASDENNGFTAGAPLKTGMELYRRWGWGNQVIVGPNLATSPDGFTNVHIVSNLVAPDALPMNVIIAANGSLRFRGGTPTNILASTALTGVTAMNPLTNTRLRLTAGALVWTPFIAANRRGRILDGAAAGATFQVQTNVGGGAADCSAAQKTNEPGFSQIPTTVTPAPGDHFVIESLVECNFGFPFIIEQSENPTIGGFDVFVNFVDINLPATPNQTWGASSTANATGGVRFNYYNCTFERNVDFSGGSNQSIASYYFNASITRVGQNGFNATLAGGGSNATTVQSIVFGGSPLDTAIDNSFVANNCNIFSVTGTMGTFGSFNAQAIAGNPGAHALLVGIGSNATFNGQRGDALFKGTVFGAGGAGRGIYVCSACSAVGAPQVVTGGAGDFALANRTTGWFFDAAAAVYNPAAGPLAFSWANLAAAQPAGFAGDAHNPVQNAHWVPTEAGT